MYWELDGSLWVLIDICSHATGFSHGPSYGHWWLYPSFRAGYESRCHIRMNIGMVTSVAKVGWSESCHPATMRAISVQGTLFCLAELGDIPACARMIELRALWFRVDICWHGLIWRNSYALAFIPGLYHLAAFAKSWRMRWLPALSPWPGRDRKAKSRSIAVASCICRYESWSSFRCQPSIDPAASHAKHSSAPRA